MLIAFLVVVVLLFNDILRDLFFFMGIQLLLHIFDTLNDDFAQGLIYRLF